MTAIRKNIKMFVAMVFAIVTVFTIVFNEMPTAVFADEPPSNPTLDDAPNEPGVDPKKVKTIIKSIQDGAEDGEKVKETPAALCASGIRFDSGKNCTKKKKAATKATQGAATSAVQAETELANTLTNTYTGAGISVDVRANDTTPLGTYAHSEEEQPFDFTKFIVCTLLPFEGAHELVYKAARSDWLWFTFHSKQVVSPGAQSVEDWFNKPLEFALGKNFGDSNKNIVGFYPQLDVRAKQEALKKAEEKMEAAKSGAPVKDEKPEFNGGDKVTAFERFGAAGLFFTKYLGEWRYIDVNVCSENPNVSDKNINAYYEGRKEPLETWDDISGSFDPRVQKVRPAAFSAVDEFNDMHADGLFNLQKLLVILTITFVGFAFSDIVEYLGVGKMIWGDTDPSAAASGSKGLVGALFENLYFPLMIVFIIIIGVWFLYKAGVKRAVRESFGQLFKSFMLIVLAVWVAVDPVTILSLPNKASVLLQSVVVSAFESTDITSGNLCTVTKSPTKARMEIKADTSTSFEDATKMLEEMNKKTRSAIGCQMWEAFLFTPWAEAQWGTHWSNLFAKDPVEGGKILDVSDINKEMTGDAAVPLGAGETFNNWALYQISTQTDVHSQYGKDAIPANYGPGVANDWFRVVDAVANVTFQQEEVSAGEEKATQDVYDKDAETTPYWDTWTATVTGGRFGSVFVSGIVTTLGVITPLILSVIATAIALVLAFLMAFAPFFLLIGLLPGKGTDIFRGYLELLLNTIMKRIIVGLVLAIDLLLINLAIKVFHETSKTAGLLMLFLLLFVIRAFWKKMVELFANIRISSHGAAMGDALSTGGRKLGSLAKGAGKTAVTGAALVGAGIASKKAGGKFLGGVKRGTGALLTTKGQASGNFMVRAFSDEMARSKSVRDVAKGQKEAICVNCGRVLSNERAGVTPAGDMFCIECLSYIFDMPAGMFLDTTMEDEYNKQKPRMGSVNTPTGKVIPAPSFDELVQQRLMSEGSMLANESVPPIEAVKDLTQSYGKNSEKPDRKSSAAGLGLEMSKNGGVSKSLYRNVDIAGVKEMVRRRIESESIDNDFIRESLEKTGWKQDYEKALQDGDKDEATEILSRAVKENWKEETGRKFAGSTKELENELSGLVETEAPGEPEPEAEQES